MQVQQRKLLLSEEIESKPRSVTRVIVYTLLGILSAIAIYTLLCISSFIFLVWFTINGDIKPALKIAYNLTQPLQEILVETKLKEHSTKEKN